MSKGNAVVDVTSTAAYTAALATRKAEDAKSGQSNLVVVYYWASWHPPCAQMNEVVAEMAQSPAAANVLFLRVDVDAQSDVAEQQKDAEIDSVPTFLFYKNQKLVATLKGASAPDFVALVTAHAKPTAHTHVPPQPAVAAATSASSNSQTTAVSIAAAKSTSESKAEFDARLTALTNAAPVVVFMKGSPQQPKCGFSRQLVEILNDCRVNFGYFDILTDNAVREGLKVLSNWPTYPQLYCAGKLVGGLDIVKELKEGAELMDVFPKEALSASASGADLTKRLVSLINAHRIMLFMKGTPDEPECGFSKKAVALLRSIVGTAPTAFGHFNIFTDETVRMGLKEYSNWPTYPQLYVDGKLIGGLDVMNEMHEEKEFAPLLLAKPASAAATATAATATATISSAAAPATAATPAVAANPNKA